MTSKWLEKKCPVKEDKVFKSSELESYFSQLKTNSNYRMKDDQGLCKQRAFFLAEELASNGYSPRLIYFTSDTQGLGLNVQSNGKELSYADHWVVLIKDSNGIEQALDPQFMENNLKLEDYIKAVSPKAPAKLRQMNLHYLVKLMSPSDINKSCKELESEIHSLMLNR